MRVNNRAVEGRGAHGTQTSSVTLSITSESGRDTRVAVPAEGTTILVIVNDSSTKELSFP